MHNKRDDIVNNNEEEMDIVGISKQIESIDIQIPDDLDNIIASKIDTLKPRLYRKFSSLIRIASVLLVCFISFVGLIYGNSEFAKMVSDIPGVEKIVDWIYQDAGSKYAHDHEYPVIDMLAYEKDGYKLVLSNIIIDEERMSFNVLLSGQGVGESSGETQVAIDDTKEEDQVINYDTWDLIFRIEDEHLSVTQSRISLETAGMARSVDIFFATNARTTLLRTLIDEGKPLVLDVKAQYGTNKNTLKKIEFDSIKIPINSDNVLLSKHYDVDQLIVFEQGEVLLNELIVSPTKMILRTESMPKGEVAGIDLDQLVIVDSNGNEHKSEGVIKWGHGEGIISYEFVPSIYFDEFEEVTLQYGSYNYYYDQVYNITLDDVPQTIDYYGYEVDITKFHHNGKNLIIELEYKEFQNFKFQNILIEEELYNGGMSWGVMFDDDNNEIVIDSSTIYEVVPQDNYDIELGYPSLMIDQSGQVIINLD